ncbi:choice-of-anchor I family protein [Flavobacterium sp.]|uniref:choice-of-anchor I family protein n=1 Tax=Flavobacterium sp. TaxID=239 RepID=UPI00286DA104|nr:choice-of-anchor I family protein [Flavobacterium sp.]
MSKFYTLKRSLLLFLFIFSITYSWGQTISFASNFIVTNENQGILNVALNLVNPTTSSVNLVVKTAPFSTANAADFTLATQTLNFTTGSATTQTITIPIIDDNQLEQHSEYFVLSLESPTGMTISGNPLATIYIKDNETVAPVPNNDIQLDYVGSFDPSGAGVSTCEIVVHDPISQKLFTISAISKKLEIINFANPSSLSLINSIDMTPYGGITSVAVKNGVVAVASPNANEQLDGSVVFFDTSGTFLKQLTVGTLPDMITFTPDGNKVLTANEGQPNLTYSIDPEGSVSIIDVSGGIFGLTQANVTTLFFTGYNSQENSLIASGIRKTKSSSTLSQDFEPEYITISADSQKAWVTIQENNAIAEINLTNNTYVDVWALGTKDVSIPGKGMDISDNNGEVLIANWPIKSYYIPDAVANYSVGGTNYLVTANEGDEKEYGTALNERTTIGAATFLLDASIFPNAAVLKSSNNAGRMRVTNLKGNTDADPEFEQIYSVGSRSFSIFNANTKTITYDSGDDFERYTALTPALSTIFNTDHSDNIKKGRSRAKGPEPEGIVLAELGGKTFAFISLERVGGVMVYDITNPNDAKFVDYKNSRIVSAFGGDNGPEGVTFIKATDSPNNKNYLAVANEISGTISLFEVNTSTLSTNSFENEPKTFVIFPNPNEKGILYFNRIATYELFDFSGKLVQSEKEALTIETSKLSAGIYIVKTSEGIVKKLVVK